MLALWGCLAGLLLYLEIVYHFGAFGWVGFHPIYTLALIVTWSGIGTLLVGIIKGRWKKIAFYFSVWFPIIWVSVQEVYISIFRQPLLWEAVIQGGQDALTNYWRETLYGILCVSPILLLMFLPGIVIGIVIRVKKYELPDFGHLQILRTVVVLVVGIAGQFVILELGKALEQNYYEEYTEFYDPYCVAESMGFLPMLQRDTLSGVYEFIYDEYAEDVFPVSDILADAEQQEVPEEESEEASEDVRTENSETQPEDSSAGIETEDKEGVEDDTQEGSVEDKPEEQPVIRPHQFNIDYQVLQSLADNKKQNWLAEYIEGQIPANTNEYTGLFEGYNLIFLTAEGFSTPAIREDLTPTLYRLVNSGFVFENYYVPLWSTSTSDGEYINCTGLIPDGQFSMRESSDNDMAYVLPKFFEAEGVTSYAYHNNSLSYYDRHLSHPNLGYDFKASLLGDLPAEEWGSQIFPMENPKKWPASDLEMMQGTLPEYLQQERFHVYYLTVSGHMNYNFAGNSMSSKNRDAVAHLEMSETARAYLACQIELDKALEYLLAQLEAAGQLEKTVICLSADHYPYAMPTENYEELVGKTLDEGMDLYRNSLILWNAGMEAEPVHVEKVCGSMDLLPTLLNLFGFEYDSRMYAGRDIFSEGEGMVIFKDRSFVTDSLTYIRKGKEVIWTKDASGNDVIAEEEKEAYLDAMQQEAKDRYQFSAYILQEDYYTDIKQALLTEP